MEQADLRANISYVGGTTVFLVAVLSSLEKAFLGIGATNALVNILALTGSFFNLYAAGL